MIARPFFEGTVEIDTCAARVEGEEEEREGRERREGEEEGERREGEEGGERREGGRGGRGLEARWTDWWRARTVSSVTDMSR